MYGATTTDDRIEHLRCYDTFAKEYKTQKQKCMIKYDRRCISTLNLLLAHCPYNVLNLKIENFVAMSNYTNYVKKNSKKLLTCTHSTW